MSYSKHPLRDQPSRQPSYESGLDASPTFHYPQMHSQPSQQNLTHQPTYQDEKASLTQHPVPMAGAAFPGDYYPPTGGPGYPPSGTPGYPPGMPGYPPPTSFSGGMPTPGGASSMVSDDDWRRRARPVQRGITRRVKLTQGNFINDYP
jgi:hypothetical protein